MKTPRRTLGLAGAALTVILATGAPVQAAVIPGWYSTTDLIFALQRGNSDSLNVGVNANVTRQWLRTAWRNQGSFVRNDVNEPGRLAIGTNANNAVLEKGESVTKSEKIFFNSNLERRITERFFWNAGGSFERDVFAGLESRYLGQLGIGYMWLKPDNSSRFQLGVAGTYTSQEEVIDDPETENQFAGIRATADGEARFGDRKEHAYTSTLVLDENLQQTEDLRANWQNALSMSLNRKLALKVSLQFAYDNLPQLVEFPLFTRLPNGSLVETQIQIPGEADKLDTTLSVSLVINFAPGNQGAGGR
jgi:hypothetical protein